MSGEHTGLPAELVDAVTVLLRYADRAPTASLELKEAVRTAREYLPRPFAAEDIDGLPRAIGIVAALATRRYPGNKTVLNGWPDQCNTSRAEYVHGVLQHHNALPLIVVNAAKLAEETMQPRLATAASELSRRLTKLPDTTPDDLPRWANSIHEAVVELHGYLLGVPHRVPRVRP